MSEGFLKTERLTIRAFLPEDLGAVHAVLNRAFGGDAVNEPAALDERALWLQWSMLNQEWLPKLRQPPYGDRAIVLNATGTLIGVVGYVPALNFFERIPELRTSASSGEYAVPEVGLFWAIDPDYQRRGYATEAARAIIDHAFTEMRLKRIVATTEYENLASQGVMRSLGMNLCRNPLPDPPWLQIVGVLENPGSGGTAR